MKKTTWQVLNCTERNYFSYQIGYRWERRPIYIVIEDTKRWRHLPDRIGLSASRPSSSWCAWSDRVAKADGISCQFISNCGIYFPILTSPFRYIVLNPIDRSLSILRFYLLVFPKSFLRPCSLLLHLLRTAPSSEDWLHFFGQTDVLPVQFI